MYSENRNFDSFYFNEIIEGVRHKGLPDIKQVFIQPVRIMNRSPAGVLLPLTYWN
jgi:hypothetical protein